MDFFDRLRKQVSVKKSCLCVGLDPNPNRFPEGISKDGKGALEFLKKIVDATESLSVAYKPQIAYFSAYGWESILKELIEYIHSQYDSSLVVLDAKRGDIGATAEMYAKESFERYNADAVTLNPYMGWDTVSPFLKYENRGVFLLCRTSNPSAEEMQNIKTSDDLPYYQYMAQALSHHSQKKTLGWVVGATAEEEMVRLRSQFPAHWFLVPGVGAQGGSLEKTMNCSGFSSGGGVLVNSSRGILYSGSGPDFAEKSRRVAEGLVQQMEPYIEPVRSF